MEFTGERYVPDKFDESNYISELHTKRYEFALNFIEGLSIVDIACGEGYGSNLLATKAKSVLGIDINQEAIDSAKIKYVKNNLSFDQGSVNNIPIPDSSIDVVISFETIEHVDDRTQNIFLNEILRILKPSGILIISTPDKDMCGEGHNEFHVCEMNLQEFSLKLKKYFPNVIFYGQDLRSYTNKFSLFIRRIFHKIIKFDKFKLRHKIFPKKVRSKIDDKLLQSSSEKIAMNVTKDNYFPVKIKDNETAMYLVVVCKKK